MNTYARSIPGHVLAVAALLGASTDPSAQVATIALAAFATVRDGVLNRRIRFSQAMLGETQPEPDKNAPNSAGRVDVPVLEATCLGGIMTGPRPLNGAVLLEAWVLHPFLAP